MRRHLDKVLDLPRAASVKASRAEARSRERSQLHRGKVGESTSSL
ncbi:MAG: hypothetical protein QW584_02250 [Thermofilaceae archaeon]